MATRSSHSVRCKSLISIAIVVVLAVQVYLSLFHRFDPGFRSYPDRAMSTPKPPSSSWADSRSSTTSADSSFGGIHPRAFETWKHGNVPCLSPDHKWFLPAVHRSPAREGLFLVKEMKTGGSTAAGIHLRIARNEAQRQFPSQRTFCKTRNDHVVASRMEYNHRDRTKSFLWTVIRDPTERAISQFFHFEVSRNKVEPTDRHLKQWIHQSHDMLNHYYLSTLSVDDVLNTAHVDQVATANKILLDYDFVGVTERMEESAVALQLLLGLTTGDILYLNAKKSGGFDIGMQKDRECTYIVPSFVSPGMKDFFQSTAWKKLITTDTFLHQAANRSLDLTIDRLGRDRFDRALGRFRQALRHIEKVCLSNTTFPCNAAGERIKPKDRDCLWYDSGCGTGCLDKLADEWDLYRRTV